MMHGSMWLMMAVMWLFWGVLIAGIVLAVVLSTRALRESRRYALAAPAAEAFRVVKSDPPVAVAPVFASPIVSDDALRILDDDLRRLYELVAERGGEVVQSDLVTLTGWSKSKVSKALDRLESKGLLVRLRRGMSNRVVLAPAKEVS